MSAANTFKDYKNNVNPSFLPELCFSDGTEDYRIPSQPKAGQQVTIRFRIGRGNVDRVWLVSDDRKIDMNLTESNDRFDYYQTMIQLEDEIFHYHFELQAGNLYCCYDRMGIDQNYRSWSEFAICPDFYVPEWAKGAVMYQIFVERFCNGDPTNDVLDHEYYYINRQTSHVANWDKTPNGFDVADFYGGDLAGVISKLDYLQKLGVEVLYLNPIFASASSHKYDTQDYDYVDPHFGVILDDQGDLLEEGESDNRKATRFISRVTSKRNLEASNQLFIQLVEEAHKRGMKVLLDGVFNHCGSFNKWLDREHIYEKSRDHETGAYISPDSPYRDFFKFTRQDDWPNNDSYEGWWGHNTLPKLNYEESQALENYILEIGRKWVSPPYNVDGWRLDVAADLGHSVDYNHEFWKKFRQAVKEANPEALILAEHYGESREWLQGDQWDTLMNYDAFMEPVSWFLTGMEKHSEEYKEDMLGNQKAFADTMKYKMLSYMTPSLQASMNQLSNHDHSRFMTRTNHKVGRLDGLGPAAASQDINKGVYKEAVVLQMTWPGAPTLYYGDEAGVCGFTDPDNRRTYPWGHEDTELLKFHRDIISIHRDYQALRTGSLMMLDSDQDTLAFARFNKKQRLITLINNSEKQKSFQLNLLPIGVPESCQLVQLIYTREENHSMRGVIYKIENGMLKINLPKYSSVVLLHEEYSED